MDQLKKSLKNWLEPNVFIHLIFSNRRSKQNDIEKVQVYPIDHSKFDYQIKHHFSNREEVFNLVSEEVYDSLLNYLSQYKQINVFTTLNDFQILLNKQLEAKIIKKNATKKLQKTIHNKAKAYLIPEGKPCDFLIEIGVMQPNGKVKASQYKKFKQINRFLELVDDLRPNFEKNHLKIMDFGCGKSYLTFAIYYYFTQILHKSVEITGVDIKPNVIADCNRIAKKIHYTNLNFVHGYIHEFHREEEIDLVVTLHACDTATDDAILFAVKQRAQNMLFVPCCQHELNSQLENSTQAPLIKSGILRDRMTAIVTDTMRAMLIEACGYSVQTMEFIDMEHTAKNILLRVSKTERNKRQSTELFKQYQSFKQSWNIEPYLEKELIKQKFL